MFYAKGGMMNAVMKSVIILNVSEPVTTPALLKISTRHLDKKMSLKF
jgi:hypothetical protein